MSDPVFTGERIHAGSTLFALDLARHQAAYEFARRHARAGWLLDLGCGSGYGAATLAGGGARVIGVDRVPPDATSRGRGVWFVRGDLHQPPFAEDTFDLIVSFQVIEHLEDPEPYLAAIAELLRPGGTALLTTPNRLASDGVNPYHVHEYVADELAARLRARFAGVEIRGIGASQPVRRRLAERSRRIRHILKLDPFRLRDRLPRRVVQWLFARFALLVRCGTSRREDPEVTWRDFPVGAADDECLDLLAICPRRR